MKSIQFINDFENHLKQEINILSIKKVFLNPIGLFTLIAIWPISIFFLILTIWQAHKIKKDLKGKHYLPLQMKVISKHYQKSDGENPAQYLVQLQHAATTHLLSKYARKKLANKTHKASFKTTIQVSHQIYDRLQPNQTAFFLVGHHSGIWMSQTKPFAKTSFGENIYYAYLLSFFIYRLCRLLYRI